MNSPSAENFCTRSLRQSAMYMSPAPSMAMPPRQVQLPVAVALRAEAAQELPDGGELLHAVVMVVNDIDIVVRINRQPGGTIQFAVRRTGAAPTRQRIARRVEARDSVEVLAGYICITRAVSRNRRGPDELAVALAILPECRVVVAIGVIYGNAQAAIVAVKRPAHRIDLAVAIEGRVHRIVEPAPFHSRKTDGMAVLQEICLLCSSHRSTSLLCLIRHRKSNHVPDGKHIVIG